MPTIIRSPRAKADILSAARYIVEESESVETAERWMDSIDAKVIFLGRNPLAGEARPDLGQELRAFPVGNYIIFYRPRKDGIQIVRVLHGARDIPRIFRTE